MAARRRRRSRSAMRSDVTLLFHLVSNICTITRVKRCTRCGLTKSLAAFHRSRRRHDGVQSVCRSCRAEMDHARYVELCDHGLRRAAQKRSAWLLSLKTGKPCADCGETFPPEVMQFDHRPGTFKRGSISGDLRGAPRAIIREEMAKCDLVCANCHIIRTHERARSKKESRGSNTSMVRT
jgi:hypothetical protein